jgi:integrase
MSSPVATPIGSPPSTPGAKAILDRRMQSLSPDSPLKDWRLHDLRRTIASHLAERGTPTDVADRILNHVNGVSRSGVKGVYQRYEFLAERKKALEDWGRYVGELVASAD